MAFYGICLSKERNSLFIFNKINLHFLHCPGLSLNKKKFRYRDDTLFANEVDGEYSQWFSNHLGIKCKLVFFSEENPRPVNPKYKVNNENVSFADAYPFLIIGQSSLDDLNSRLKESLPMNRFRPNLVFTGGEPYEEDHWRNFTIGSNRFVGVKLCDRCVLTTVNQDTVQKGAEPLKTLATYRQRDNKIYFGQNLVGAAHSRARVAPIRCFRRKRNSTAAPAGRASTSLCRMR